MASHSSRKVAEPISDKSAEAAELIRGCFTAIRKIQSELSDPEKLDAEVRRCRAIISAQQKRVDEIDELLLLGQERIQSLYDQIAEARQMQHAERTARRAVLQAQFDALVAELEALK